MLALRLLLVAFVGVLLCTPCMCLSVADVQKMQDSILSVIKSSAQVNAVNTTKYPLVGTVTRLTFHDCNGPNGCDGCLNLNIQSNKGLQPAVTALEAIYTNATLGFKAKITRADFWALAGLTAVNFGASLQKAASPYIPTSLVPTKSFKTGRKDCTSSPAGNETDASFPDALKGQADTLKFFNSSYNFNATETVAIMGAHTLGKARVENSGFRDPWVPGDNILNNGYYRDMSNASAGWVQITVPQTNKTQWERNSTVGHVVNQLMMLNADMGLYKNLLLNSTGGCSCKYSACALSSTATTVAMFGNNNQAWLDAFGAVFNKMISVCGRSNGKVVPCTLSALTSSASPVVTTSSVEGAAAAADAPTGPGTDNAAAQKVVELDATARAVTPDRSPLPLDVAGPADASGAASIPVEDPALTGPPSDVAAQP